MILSKRPRTPLHPAKPRSSSLLCISLAVLASLGTAFALASSAASASASAKDKCAAAPSHMRIFVKPGTKHIRGVSMTLPSVPTSCNRSVRYGILGAMYNPDPDKMQVMGRSYSVKTDDRRKLSEPDTWAFTCNSSNDDAIVKPYATVTYTKAGKRVTKRFPSASSTKWPIKICKKSSRRSAAASHRSVLVSAPRDSGSTDAEEPPTPGTPVPLPGEEPAPTPSPKSEEEKACADKALLAPTGISGKYKVYENYAFSYKLVATTSVLPKSCKKFGKLILTGLQQVSDKHHDWRPGSNELLLATNPAKRARVSRTLRAPRNCWKGGLFGDPDKKNKTVGRAAVKSTWIPKHGKTLIAIHHAKAKKLCK